MYRIKLKSKTAFFRNDSTVTSIQETFDCPPLSTVYGLISAAMGEKVEDVTVGYIFEYSYKQADYELITRQVDKTDIYSRIKQNPRDFSRSDVLQGCFGAIPVTREVLFECTLLLYLQDKELADSFRAPYYSLLMGRSEDIAQVISVKEVDLKEGMRNIYVGKTIVPFDLFNDEISGRICSMAVNIAYEIPRKVIRSGIFIVADKYQKTQNSKNAFLFDENIRRGIYLHTYDQHKRSESCKSNYVICKEEF